MRYIYIYIYSSVIYVPRHLFAEATARHTWVVADVSGIGKRSGHFRDRSECSWRVQTIANGSNRTTFSCPPCPVQFTLRPSDLSTTSELFSYVTRETLLNILLNLGGWYMSGTLYSSLLCYRVFSVCSRLLFLPFGTVGVYWLSHHSHCRYYPHLLSFWSFWVLSLCAEHTTSCARNMAAPSNLVRMSAVAPDSPSRVKGDWTETSAFNTDLALEEGRVWIEQVVGEKFGSGTFQESTKDGVLLCRYVR